MKSLIQKKRSIGLLALFTIGCASSVSAKSVTDYEIAYLRLTDNYWQAWVTDRKGQRHKQVTTAAIDKVRISWSKDRKELLCNRNDGTLVRVSVETGKTQPIKLPIAGMLDAQWSPDNQWIVFSHSPKASPDTNDVWIVKTNGRNLHKIDIKPRLQLTPSWGSKGESIVYTSGLLNKNNTNIWIINLKKGSKMQLTQGKSLKFDPMLSSTGDVAYSSNQKGNYDIWMLKQGTQQPVQITNSTNLEAQPAWSLDGQQFAYYTIIDGQRMIKVRNLATGKTYPLTPADAPSRYPAWSR